MSMMAASLNKRIKRSLISILEFAEAPFGPRITLSPAQRFSIKLGYRIPLDSTVKDICIYDKFKEKLLTKVSEVEYRAMLFDEGRLNLPHTDSHLSPHFNSYIRCWGRRAGKSEITALDMAYGIYLLLEMYDPHEYYNMPPNTEIYIPVLGTSQDSSKRTFRKVRNMLASSGYFSSYCNKEDLQELFCKVFTPYQREHNAQFPSIIVQAFPLSESQVRGPASFRAVCDEMAHWPHRGDTTDEGVISSIEPSLTTFKHTPDTPSDGKIFMISNAGTRSGYFYDAFNEAIRQGDKCSTIAYQAPTYELNPDRISSIELKDAFNKHGDARYRTEYLSEFVDSITQWLSNEELNAMLDGNRANSTIKAANTTKAYIFFPRAVYPQYFYGFDLGSKNDACGLAIGHWEFNDIEGTKKLVFDYVERRKAGEAPCELMPRITGEYCAEWIHEMSQIYPISDGVFDQWSGTLFGEMLNRRNVKNLRMVTFTQTSNSEVYHSFRALSLNKLLSIPTANNKKLEEELQLLQCEMLPNEKIKVAAPVGPQYHDDMFDAVARVCWVASEALNPKAEGKKPVIFATLQGSVSGSTYGRTNVAEIARLRVSATTDPRAAAKLMAIRNKKRF